MDIRLTPAEIQELRRIQKKEKFHLGRFIKATVLLMLHQGVSIDVICASLSLDDNTIYRHVKVFREKGLGVYLKDNYAHYGGKLTHWQERALAVHLEENLYPDCKSICVYEWETFGLKYTISGMRDLLHRLGFVYKKAKKVPGKADEEQQRAFLQKTLPGMLEEVKDGKAEVSFTDGTHPTHNTGDVRGWIRRGEDFDLDCNSGRQRVNINAAVRAIKPEHVVYDIAESINAQSTQRLCRKLLRKHPGKKIYLICDNARYYRCSWLQEWAKKQRIEFVFLPSYSPNLNITERLWRLLRKEVINLMYYDTYSKFRNNIIHFLENIKDYKEEVRSLLTLNLRTVGNISFHLSQTIS